MSRAIALATPLMTATGRIDALEAARRVIVLGCAASLILAGAFFPL